MNSKSVNQGCSPRLVQGGVGRGQGKAQWILRSSAEDKQGSVFDAPEDLDADVALVLIKPHAATDKFRGFAKMHGVSV